MWYPAELATRNNYISWAVESVPWFIFYRMLRRLLAPTHIDELVLICRNPIFGIKYHRTWFNVGVVSAKFQDGEWTVDTAWCNGGPEIVPEKNLWSIERVFCGILGAVGVFLLGFLSSCLANFLIK